MKITMRPVEDLVIAMVWADPTLLDADVLKAICEGPVELEVLACAAARGDELARYWPLFADGTEKRVTRKKGEILARWPSPANRREGIRHACAYMQVEFINARLERLRRAIFETARTSGPVEAKKLLDVSRDLVARRASLMSYPDEAGGP